MWWRDAVVYQVYPRSFQDSDGDGVGDLPGIIGRLDHLVDLGVDALWLSPIMPSPMADFGYDVSCFDDVDPVYGSLEDFDRLVAAVHGRGLRLIMDLVPCHTSIEHPWFDAHPRRYVRRPPAPAPPNNWVASFGGPAWDVDPHEPARGWYLHSFYPEQPDLDWRNPEVAEAMGDVVRFWLRRGADGYRLDALDRLLKDPDLRDDPVASGPPPLPLPGEYAALDHVHSVNAPDIGRGVAQLREAAGDAFLVGEVYLPTAALGPYLEHLDAAFSFELYHAPWEPQVVRAAIETGVARVDRPSRLAWVLSNHDFPRLPTRVGPGRERLAALLLLSLPGPVFVYQGDEIGMPDGPGADPPLDRAGRDAFRHPMQWEPGPGGGFTTGAPWLPLVDPGERNVADQRGDPGSLLSLYRDVIALRRDLGPGLAFVESGSPDVLAFRRGEDHIVVLNFADEPRDAPPHGQVLLAAHSRPEGRLAPGGGFVALVTG